MSLAPTDFLKIAYVANILILIPVCLAMIRNGGTGLVFQGVVADEAGLRLLVFSLWTAILLASAAGLIWPAFFAPLLLVQIVYKSLWLALFVMPLIMRGAPWPVGIATCFAAIVATYPVLFWLGTRSA